MSCLASILALFCLFGGLSEPAQAQKKPVDSPGRLPLDGADKLLKEYSAKSGEFRSLAKGDRVATKEDTELIDLGVKFHVYRLTWEELTKKPGGSTLLINQLETVLGDALRNKSKKAPNSVAFLEIFGWQMGVRLKELLGHQVPLVRINAALMLPLAARAGNPEIAPLLTEVVRDESQNEAVRYWAVNALRELFALTRQSPPLRMRPEQEEPAIAALNEYLQRPPEFPDRIVSAQQRLQQIRAELRKGPATAEEVKKLEEEKKERKNGITADERKKLEEEQAELEKEITPYGAGMQMARRAAVRALAETRYPALLKRVEGRNVPDEKGLTALALTRVVANDVQSLSRGSAKKAKGVPPAVSLGEQVEAAIGLCQLQSDLTNDYNPDYAAHHVGRFLVEFVNRHENERARKLEPWKNHSGRLLAALGELRDDTKKRSRDAKAAQYIQAMINQAEPILQNVERGAEANPANLSAWLETPSPNPTLYKGLDKAVVKPAVDPNSP